MAAHHREMVKQAFSMLGWSSDYKPKAADIDHLNSVLAENGIPEYKAKVMLEQRQRQMEGRAKVPDPPSKLKGFWQGNKKRIGLAAAGLAGAYGVYKMMQPPQPSEEEMAAMQAQQGGF